VVTVLIAVAQAVLTIPFRLANIPFLSILIGVIIGGRFYLLSTVLVAEDLGIDAIARTWDLGKGYVWYIFKMFAIVYGAFLLLVAIAAGVVLLFNASHEPAANGLPWPVVAGILIAATPYFVFGIFIEPFYK